MLTQGQTSTFEKFVGNMSSSSNSTSNSSTINQTVNNHGMSDKQFQRMMTRNSGHAVDTLRRGMRRGAA